MTEYTIYSMILDIDDLKLICMLNFTVPLMVTYGTIIKMMIDVSMIMMNDVTLVIHRSRVDS